MSVVRIPPDEAQLYLKAPTMIIIVVLILRIILTILTIVIVLIIPRILKVFLLILIMLIIILIILKVSGLGFPVGGSVLESPRTSPQKELHWSLQAELWGVLRCLGLGFEADG